MAVARYYKTFFMPPLEGQHKIWKYEFSKIAIKVDEIVQFGNLIGISDLVKDKPDRGANLSVLNYIALWRSTYSNWHQLIGPNEIIALNFPDKFTNTASNRILRSRWLTVEDEELHFKVATVNKNRLVTHGGLTHGLWKALGEPQTAQEAAELLNSRYQGTLYQGRAYKWGDAPNFSADPIFADPLREVYPSWITAVDEMPFSQVHSANGYNTFEGHQLRNADGSILSYMDKIENKNFGSIATMSNGKSFLAITPFIPKEKIVNYVPQPWRTYVENIPVVDLGLRGKNDN